MAHRGEDGVALWAGLRCGLALEQRHEQPEPPLGARGLLLLGFDAQGAEAQRRLGKENRIATSAYTTM